MEPSDQYIDEALWHLSVENFFVLAGSSDFFDLPGYDGLTSREREAIH
jgi:hypothetical protein